MPKRRRGNPKGEGSGKADGEDPVSITTTEDEQPAEVGEIAPPSFEKINFKLPFIELTPQSASRLLHPNPVCLLSSIGPNNHMNVMPISWLTPANNHGGIALVIHKSRASAANLLDKKEFMLSIVQAEQRPMVLACGKVTGNKINKLDGSVRGLKRKVISTAASDNSNFNLFSVFDDGSDDEDSDTADAVEGEEGEGKEAQRKDATVTTEGDGVLHPIAETIAHMKCNLLQHHEAADPGHWLVTAQIVEAQVHPQYWDGKCLCRTSSSLPPLLSFIGSQRFSFIVEETSPN
jgi:flavin reductase (DIM6/NTAB) family NADH-FMN oxidoreductase RutF